MLCRLEDIMKHQELCGQRLGRADRVRIWRDEKLTANELFDHIIEGRIDRSEVRRVVGLYRQLVLRLVARWLGARGRGDRA